MLPPGVLQITVGLRINLSFGGFVDLNPNHPIQTLYWMIGIQIHKVEVLLSYLYWVRKGVGEEKEGKASGVDVDVGVTRVSRVALLVAGDREGPGAGDIKGEREWGGEGEGEGEQDEW